MDSSSTPSHFDPYSQVFVILGPDGVTQIPVSMKVLDFYVSSELNDAISYAGQLTICGLMLIILLCLTPRSKLLRPSGVLNLLGLTSCFVSRVLLTVSTVMPVANVYRTFANYYDDISLTSAIAFVVAGSTVSTVVHFVMEIALAYQAWTLVRMWPRVPKWIISILSLLLVLTVLGMRLAELVFTNRDAVVGGSNSQYDALWLIQDTVIVTAVSIFWFAAVFNSRLVMHLWQNRGVLPTSSSLTPMEVLVVVNGVMMVVPVIFAGIQWSAAGDSFESTSWSYTSVIVLLPLGSLIAQRVTGGSLSGGRAGGASGSAGKNSSGWTPKRSGRSGANINTNTTVSGGVGAAGFTPTVESRVEAMNKSSGGGGPRDAVDRELAELDDFPDTASGSNVRVEHEIDQSEKRI